MDRIHKRYVSYLNQSPTQRDSTKTEYTYAKSYSYRRHMDISLMYEWSVPNICRKSINSVGAVIKISDTLSAISKIDSNQLLSVFIKTLKFGDYSVPKSKSELLANKECAVNNEVNVELLKYIRLRKSTKRTQNCYSLNSISGEVFTDEEVLSDDKESEHEINYLKNELEFMRSDLKSLNDLNNKLKSVLETKLNSRDNEIKFKDNSENIEQNSGHSPKDINSGSNYLVCNSDQKPDFTPKEGVLQLVSIISKEGQNSFTSLYRFKVNPK